MKNFLLLLLFCVSLNFLSAQGLPCVINFKGNNGGGNCGLQDCNGISDEPTGTVTLTFSAPIPEGAAPAIIGIECFGRTCLSQAELDAICFVPYLISNDRRSVEYCYYYGGANTNNLFGGNLFYVFEVMYGINRVPGCPEESVLPVKLKSFAASRNNSSVELKWSTETEQNNSGFDIERLVGAGGWQSVGFVPAKKGDGNSVSEINYSFTDVNPSTVITQYRLKQVDFDAKIIYSQVRAVQGIGQLGRTIVAPNPSSNGQVNVIFESAGERRNLQLTDMVGRLVKQWNGYADNSLQLTGLQNGIYQLRIVDAATGAQSVEKIVVSGK